VCTGRISPHPAADASAASPFAAPDLNGNLAETVSRQIDRARRAQEEWAARSAAERLRCVRRLRHAIALSADALAASVQHAQRSSPAETLAAEIIPLADACRFLERKAAGALAPKRLGTRGRPWWLFGTRLTITREPYGVVLILGPWNYPLFLPGVQAIQALTAGNAVILKPGCGGSAATVQLARLCDKAGVPRDLIAVLPESVEAAEAAIAAGVDKVVLTGSAETGRSVLAQLAPRLVPATMELSGCDAVIVRADADLDLVVSALVFGLRLNGGATCIAPRRVFVHHTLAADLEERLVEAVASLGPAPVDPAVARRVQRAVVEAVVGGARLLTGELSQDRQFRPVVVTRARPHMQLLKSDLFAPVMSLVPVTSDAAALEGLRQCPYALGAAVFGERRGAEALAAKIPAGSVVVNDLIVPTADPRLPFGGRRESGFGVTRGLEGLLEMTVVKSTSVRCSGWRPHLQPSRPGDARVLRAYLAASHAGSIRDRLAGAWEMIRAAFERAK